MLEKISNLKPAPYNPRYISEAQLERLKKSLEQDRDMLDARPLLVNKRNMHVIGGNMRLAAAKALGWEEVPVHYVDVDEKTEKRMNLKDNALYGEWDALLLADLIKDMSAEEIDASGLASKAIEEANAVAASMKEETEVPRLDEKKKCPSCGYEL